MQTPFKRTSPPLQSPSISPIASLTTLTCKQEPSPSSSTSSISYYNRNSDILDSTLSSAGTVVPSTSSSVSALLATNSRSLPNSPTTAYTNHLTSPYQPYHQSDTYSPYSANYSHWQAASSSLPTNHYYTPNNYNYNYGYNPSGYNSGGSSSMSTNYFPRQ